MKDGRLGTSAGHTPYKSSGFNAAQGLRTSVLESQVLVVCLRTAAMGSSSSGTESVVEESKNLSRCMNKNTHSSRSGVNLSTVFDL